MYIWMTGWAHRLQQKDQMSMATVNINYRRGEKSWEMCGPQVSWQNFILFGKPRKKCLTLVLFGLSLQSSDRCSWQSRNQAVVKRRRNGMNLFVCLSFSQRFTFLDFEGKRSQKALPFVYPLSFWGRFKLLPSVGPPLTLTLGAGCHLKKGQCRLTLVQTWKTSTWT